MLVLINVHFIKQLSYICKLVILLIQYCFGTSCRLFPSVLILAYPLGIFCSSVVIKIKITDSPFQKVWPFCSVVNKGLRILFGLGEILWLTGEVSYLKGYINPRETCCLAKTAVWNLKLQNKIHFSSQQ